MCVRITAQLLYTLQHRTVLIIFPLILRTIIIAQALSTGGKGQIPSDLRNNRYDDKPLCDTTFSSWNPLQSACLPPFIHAKPWIRSKIMSKSICFEHSLLPDHAFGTVFLRMSVDLICPWTPSAAN